MQNLAIYYGITLTHEEQDQIQKWIDLHKLDTYKTPFFTDVDQLIALGVKLSADELPGIYGGWSLNPEWPKLGKIKLDEWLSTKSDDNLAANMLKNQINNCQVMLFSENI